MTDDLASLHDQAVDLIRRLQTAEGTQHTELAKEVAALMVAIRPHFEDSAGGPDILGRSWAYRAFTSTLYADAGVTPEERRRMQTAVRYHTSLMTRRAYPEAVEAGGLAPTTVLERQRDRREQDARTLAMFSGRLALDSRKDIVHLTQNVGRALDRVERPADATPRELAALRARFEALADRVDSAAKRLI